MEEEISNRRRKIEKEIGKAFQREIKSPTDTELGIAVERQSTPKERHNMTNREFRQRKELLKEKWTDEVRLLYD